MATIFVRSPLALAPSARTLANRERAARAERRAAGRVRPALDSRSFRPAALDAATIALAIDAWGAPLAALARRWGVRDGEDIVQSVVVRLLSGAAESYDPARGALFSFLGTCVVREAIDAKRSWKRRAAASLDDASGVSNDRIGDLIPDASGLDPASAAVEIEILRIIDTLPEIHSATLRAWLETGSTRSIALRCGVPEGTAKRRLFDARAALAKRLA